MIAQQFQPWCRQVLPESSDADVDVFDVVETACSGPRFSVRVPALNPKTDPRLVLLAEWLIAIAKRDEDRVSGDESRANR